MLILNYGLERLWKEVVMACFNVLSPHLPGCSEESRYPFGNTNPRRPSHIRSIYGRAVAMYIMLLAALVLIIGYLLPAPLC